MPQTDLEIINQDILTYRFDTYDYFICHYTISGGFNTVSQHIDLLYWGIIDVIIL